MIKFYQPFFLVGIAVAMILFLYYFFVSREEEDLTVPDEVVAAACKEDVLAAQDASLDRVCTQVIRAHVCPEDETFIYEAPNGCEISFLESNGWIPVE